ncbi:hypothetical protein N3K66_004754 [Trichothecium roseum]|uniref:Uncharacterized protein n=1 Tax=Trichothecium roseum TaxID=47278 RepID=A0ACC0V2P2_9HYPO|nr:hypothetical protein N3K66_004754 [Trichothecium roseum]
MLQGEGWSSHLSLFFSSTFPPCPGFVCWASERPQRLASIRNKMTIGRYDNSMVYHSTEQQSNLSVRVRNQVHEEGEP